MMRVSAPVRRAARLTTAALVATAALAVPNAPAVEPNDLTGWWLAIDGTFPSLWGKRGIAPMEELLQINPDGRVTDRTMNFWAGGHKACLDKDVCSEIPPIATGRLRLADGKLVFSNVAPSKATLDSKESDPLIRQQALTATAQWQVTGEGERITLRAPNAGKVRTLVRIPPDRLRKLHAGMRVSSLSPGERWRCFLGNATARNQAFAPLHSTASLAPKFLDRNPGH